MFFRKRLAFSACFLAIALPCSAEIEDSGLTLVNPWGMSFLEEGEPSLPTNMWKASDADELLPMMRSVRTGSLTPAERTLMRRMALSPASPPSGEQEPLLRAERARIMFELGEAEAAAALMARLDDPPPDMNADEISADLNLALGNEASACDMLNEPDHRGHYWAKLRAVCATLQGNTAGAELAIEMALSQGVEDSWLLNAVFAASGELPNPPEARYNSGIALAISTQANLQPPENPLPEDRPDLAAAMATRSNLPARLRTQAALQAADAGLITDDAVRNLFIALLDETDFQPETPLETAFFASRDPLTTDGERSKALARALQAAMSSPARFMAVSRLLEKDIDRLSVSEETAAEALVFARAGLATGNLISAADWSNANTIEGADTAGDFDAALIKGLTILAGAKASGSQIDYAGNRLAQLAASDKEMHLAGRLFALWTAVGIGPPPSARSLMLQTESEPPAGAHMLLRVLADAEADAAGEVILSAVGYTDGDPQGLDTVDLTLLIMALKRIGAEDAARQLALEATGYWRLSGPEGTD